MNWPTSYTAIGGMQKAVVFWSLLWQTYFRLDFLYSPSPTPLPPHPHPRKGDILDALCPSAAELIILLQSNLIGWYIIIRRSVFVLKLDCCFQGQDHCKDSKLYWIFMSLISFVLQISWQPKKVCWFIIHNTPQWGAADTEIKVPSDGTELKGSPFKAWST